MMQHSDIFLQSTAYKRAISSLKWSRHEQKRRLKPHSRLQNRYLFFAGELIAPAANVTQRSALARWQPRILFMSSTTAIDSCIKMRQAAGLSDASSQ